MFAGLFLLSLAPFKVGGYAMPELCRQLTIATGIPHTVDMSLQDYPVFVSVKSGDAERVRKLVGVALHAEWKQDSDRFRLTPVKLGANEGIEEFERQYRAACGGNQAQLELPILDLYRLTSGETIRYGVRSSPYVRPLPPKLAARQKANPGVDQSVLIRRMTSGVFEFGQSQIQFMLLPKAVEEAIGKDLMKNVLSQEERAKINQRMQDPNQAKFDLSDLGKHDPLAGMAEITVGVAASAMSQDLVLVVPDFSIFAFMGAVSGPGTIQSVLAPFSQVVDWKVVDGGIVGCLSPCEVRTPSQTKRTVLAKFLNSVGKGVANIAKLGEYVANQRPVASNSWCDAMLLVMGGVVLDQEYIGDYPYNVRLYSKLTNNDWGLLRSTEPFPASALSAGVKASLQELLIQSRNAQMPGHPDPAFWRSIAPQDLVITASVVEEPILIGWTSMSAEVDGVVQSAHQYDMRRKSLNREPLYQPGMRRKLVLKISPVRTEEAPLEEVVTGFSEVVPDEKIKPSTWMDLPADTAKAFKTALEEMRRARENQGSDPPPPLKRL